MDGVGALLEALSAFEGGKDRVNPILIGKVVSVQPLSVRIGQLTLPRELLKTDPRCVYIPRPTEPANPHLISVGDEVLLATPNGQIFVVVCKVVNG